jgi:hypothetical protein
LHFTANPWVELPFPGRRAALDRRRGAAGRPHCTYESLVCKACTRLHLTNRATGKLLGDVERKAASPHSIQGRIGCGDQKSPLVQLDPHVPARAKILAASRDLVSSHPKPWRKYFNTS